MIQQETVVVAGSNSKAFAYTLSDHLGFKYIEAELTKFADGELKVRISEQLNCETVIIVQSTNSSASENVMELLLIADAVRQSNNIKNVIALIPYFGYSRQDKQLVTQEAVAMRVLGKIIAAAGIDHILDLLHNLFKAQSYRYQQVN
ncbi:ribose-phosphate pyrophosphokinase-like domain-containing protein [Candidatus Lariskella endosymbiont of Epinotia ramella]|uniref:ribose-phosphate pyrophosphokinase-like domain-containing protein n=1 Tax=Candidatus Lariskella endosymbiont of Epinotia ramella TaxID=3066224 RepID=UPI0030CF1E65